MSVIAGRAYAHLVRQGVSRRTALRGPWNADGRMTLVTVDFHSTDHVRRLIRSFRRFVDPDGPVVVAQNGALRDNRRLRSENVRCVGRGINIGHGLGLDLGLRHVRTEYAFVADPDSVILNDRFGPEVLQRVQAHGACSIGRDYYHPVCLVFPVGLWKGRPLSLEEDYQAGLDVAARLTDVLGGVAPGSQLELTRAAPVPYSPQWRGACYGQVWSEVFSNTYAMARKLAPGTEDLDGYPRGAHDEYHRRWAAWADGVVAGSTTVEDFPT